MTSPNRYRLHIPLLLVMAASISVSPLMATAAPAPMSGTTSAGRLEADIRYAKSKVYPALVNIFVVFKYYDSGRAHRDLAAGSGVIVSADGYVITNYHVAAHTTHIVCTLADHRSFDATDIYNDSLTDISVLKLQLPTVNGHKATVPYATFGDSNKLKVGQFVIAMGNPETLSSSLTFGVVSNTQRVFTNFTGTRIESQQLDDGTTTGLLTRWIQHDALILPGNSGGPLVNLDGQVVGINELGGDGMGFAIPSAIVRQDYHQIRATGHIIRAELGMLPVPVKKLGRTTGTLVAAVLPKSPAAKAGLKPGDVLLSVNGQPTNTLFMEQVPLLYQMVSAMRPGTIAHLRVARAGRTLNLKAVLGTMLPEVGHEQSITALGLSVRAITPMMALQYHLDNTQGALVTGVRPGFPVDSGQPKLGYHDIIVSADGRPITNPDALAKFAAQNGHKSIVLGYIHQREHLLSVIKMTNNTSADDDNTELPHAWIGIKTQVLIPEIAAAVHAPGKSGFLVTEVLPYTDAAASGLRRGDIITGLNDSPLDATRLQDDQMLNQDVENLNVGDQASLSVLRNGVAMVVKVHLQATPTSQSQAKTYRQHFLECTVRNLTIFDKSAHHWRKSQGGVLVSDITEGGWASISGLNLDDLILSINGKEISNVAQFKTVINSVIARKPKVITLFVKRGYLTDFVFVQPDWTGKSTTSQEGK